MWGILYCKLPFDWMSRIAWPVEGSDEFYKLETVCIMIFQVFVNQILRNKLQWNLKQNRCNFRIRNTYRDRLLPVGTSLFSNFYSNLQPYWKQKTIVSCFKEMLSSCDGVHSPRIQQSEIMWQICLLWWLNLYTVQVRIETKARSESHGEIFLRNKVYLIFCWIIWSAEGDKAPNYGSPQFNYGAP